VIPVSEGELRRCFVNCSKGEASRISPPRGLATLPWIDLDFLGWRDPGAPDRGYLVAERDGELVGVTLRVSVGGPRSLAKSAVCSICLTAHTASGVSLFAARKTGAAGRQGNTTGTYICADLACPLYVRGLRKPDLGGGRFFEGVSLDDQIARALANLHQFLDKVLAGTG
jgi:hypothetical protein